jgi:hypothetical protein
MKIETLDPSLYHDASLLAPAQVLRLPLPYPTSISVQCFSVSDPHFALSSIIEPIDRLRYLRFDALKGDIACLTLAPMPFDYLRPCASLVIGIYLGISHFLGLFGLQQLSKCLQSIQLVLAMVMSSSASFLSWISSLLPQAFDSDHDKGIIEHHRGFIWVRSAALCYTIKSCLESLCWHHSGMHLAMVATMKNSDWG